MMFVLRRGTTAAAIIETNEECWNNCVLRAHDIARMQFGVQLSRVHVSHQNNQSAGRALVTRYGGSGRARGTSTYDHMHVDEERSAHLASGTC